MCDSKRALNMFTAVYSDQNEMHLGQTCPLFFVIGLLHKFTCKVIIFLCNFSYLTIELKRDGRFDYSALVQEPANVIL